MRSEAPASRRRPSPHNWMATRAFNGADPRWLRELGAHWDRGPDPQRP